MKPIKAVSALRAFPLFEGVSLRLLQDLVECANRETRRADDGAAGDPATGSAALRSVLPSAVAGLRFHDGWLDRALSASFSLAHAFAGSRRDQLFEFFGCQGAHGKSVPGMHGLFLSKHTRFAAVGQPPFDVDLVEAAALLARALGRTGGELGEIGVVAVLDEEGVTYRHADGHPLGLSVPAAEVFQKDGQKEALFLLEHHRGRLFDAMHLTGDQKGRKWHVVCVHPANPYDLPSWWPKEQRGAFHRVVYLTRPSGGLRPPARLMRLLRPGVGHLRSGHGPYFSSVVPTVVLPPALARRRRTGLRCPLRQLPTLEVVPWEEPGDASTPTEPRSFNERLRRDLCRIRLDPTRLALCDQDPVIRKSLDRWARAVTNRQVGLALSGGGATSAALVPFIDSLTHNRVPIDVVAGLSGGAILGMYVAIDNLPSYLSFWQGLAFTAVAAASVITSQVIEVKINQELGGAYVEDLDVRFVPVAVEFRTDGAPRPCAVVGGTIGEGIRVSGSGIGIGMFGPSQRRGTRYLDGGVATGLPAALLPDFGADMAIACNSIVAPRGRAPTAVLPFDINPLLRLNPLLARGFDVWTDFFVGFLTMLQQSARAAAADADVYYEVQPEETPFLSAFLWCCLNGIRRRVDEAHDWESELERALECWRRLCNCREP